jgi:hypothetical protein
MAKGGIDRLESSDPDPRAQICPSLWVNQHAMWTIGFNIKGRDLMCVRSVLTPASVIQQSSITCLEPVALTRSTPFLTDLTVQAASNQDRWSQDQRPTPSLPHAATRRRRLHRATAGAIAGRPLIPHSDAFSSINWVLHVEEEMTNTMGGSLPVFAQQSWLPTVYADPRWINVVGEKFPRRGPKFTSGAASTTPTTSLGKPQGTTAGPQLQARWSSPKGLFGSLSIHVDWMGLSRFKSITSQNPSRSRPIHSNPHGSRITEQGLRRCPISCLATSLAHPRRLNRRCGCPRYGCTRGGHSFILKAESEFNEFRFGCASARISSESARGLLRVGER